MFYRDFFFIYVPFFLLSFVLCIFVYNPCCVIMFFVCVYLSITFVVRNICLFYARRTPTPLHKHWGIRPYTQVCVRHRKWRLICGHAVMEACLWSFYGGWIFELQWGPSMVNGDAVEDKGEEVRGVAIHLGISHRRRSFSTKNVPWIRSSEMMLQWRRRKREGGARNWRKKRGREVELWSLSHKTLIHQCYNKCYTCFYL